MSGKTIDEHMRAKPEKPVENELRHLRGLQQAEVAAENLTGDPNWDVFLSYLQHALNETAKQRETAQARLMDPRTVNHEQMMALKIGIAECNSRIITLQAVINLPQEIAEKGKKAKDLMERLKE